MPKKDRTTQAPSREVPKPQEGEVICVVKKMLGAEHIIVACLDGKERTARIPGRMRKKTWIKEGDVVLTAPWDFQPNKADIIYRYMNDEIRKLIEEKIISREIIDQLRG
ncbi:translation initiation factor IF-1A [Metallosphaera tengchongensis]|uniref:Translation initiation factor 1A n=1 Tax=Metallosphaera tengchongensis TaxID=1532350 RepID=A0A6N0NUM5_9CREN|nr:translation initiation factor aIF-1A [Metallosphaera tengchongensis]QKR00506.1 translation initiation factor IF-1A [Metallosphaera tengchongensis]